MRRSLPEITSRRRWGARWWTRAAAAVLGIAQSTVATAPAGAAPQANDDFADAAPHTSFCGDSGSAVNALTEVTCNDDGISVGGPSTVTFAAAASTTYWIRAGSFHYSGMPESPGNFFIAVTPNIPDLVVGLADSADPITVGAGNETYTTTVTNDGTATDNTDAESTTVNPAGANVSVAVSDSADPIALGGANLTYTVAVANASGVSVVTILSGASAAIVSSTTSQGSCSTSAPTVTCTIGALNAGAGVITTVTVTPAATGTVTATAVATLNEIDLNNADNGAGGDSANGGLGSDTCTTDLGDTTSSC